MISSETITEPEWDAVERSIMIAHDMIESERCRCGGLLSDTTENDHGYRVEPVYCGKCRAEYIWLKKQAPVDEALKDTSYDPVPQSRLLFSTPIPLPDPE